MGIILKEDCRLGFARRNGTRHAREYAPRSIPVARKASWDIQFEYSCLGFMWVARQRTLEWLDSLASSLLILRAFCALSLTVKHVERPAARRNSCAVHSGYLFKQLVILCFDALLFCDLFFPFALVFGFDECMNLL